MFYTLKKKKIEKRENTIKWEKSTNIRFLNYAEIIKCILENMQNIIFHFFLFQFKFTLKLIFV